MEKYKVSGMSCAACSARVEKAVSSLDGVESCTVNLLTNSMNIVGTVSSDDIILAVSKAGYKAELLNANKKTLSNDNEIKDSITLILKKRLISSVFFLVLLMYISMGYTMWGLPLPEVMSANPMILGLTQLLLATVVLVINQSFFVNGTKGLLHLAPNMDTLVAIGSFAAYGYSVFTLFAMADAMYIGDYNLAIKYLHNLYFESSAMIVTLITVGKMLEAKAKGKTTSALESLLKLAPKTATLIRDGEEVIVSVDEVNKGDVFLVKPGEYIPVDGRVIYGQSAINESALTGESIPVDKTIGDIVSGGTLNEYGALKCEAVRVGEDTTLSQIINLVNETASSKAPIAKVADKVAGVFVPIVLVIAILTLIVWLISGYEFNFAIARAISVLVISCPCALGLATPVAIMVGTGVGAKNGILFKTVTSLEQICKTNIVVLDKTGTITEGNPSVVGVYPTNGFSEEYLISLAFSLEKNSEHPLAKAINKKATFDNIKSDEVTDFTVMPGNGVIAKLNGQTVLGGSLRFINDNIEVSDSLKSQVKTLSQEGKTSLVFAIDNEIVGLIAVADVIKPDSKEAIDKLHKMGVDVVMLTGDNEITANHIGKEIGVDKVIAGVLPQEKEEIIRKLQLNNKVAMVGDGINDAPALMRADNGIAVGAGTDIAIDAADVVLVRNRLSDVVSAIQLSRKTFNNIKENLFWAFIYNIIGIPLAAGIWYLPFGITLNPMFGAAAMSLSSFCVVSNALRLNFFKPKEIESKLESEARTMNKTMKIEGMMCMHCEARVKQIIEQINGVTEADVDHTKDTANVKCDANVTDDMLKTAVEAQGYKVISIE